MGSDTVHSTTATVPAWVPCDRRQLQDFHRAAYDAAGRTNSARAIGMLDAIDWVVGCEPLAPISQTPGEVTEMVACGEMNLAPSMPRENTWARGVGEGLAYLVGLLSVPPLQVPNRNPDGSLVTADQRYQQLIADLAVPSPEQRDKARQQAELEYARSVRLAGLG